jgi:hypothetical protein
LAQRSRTCPLLTSQCIRSACSSLSLSELEPVASGGGRGDGVEGRVSAQVPDAIAHLLPDTSEYTCVQGSAHRLAYWPRSGLARVGRPRRILQSDAMDAARVGRTSRLAHVGSRCRGAKRPTGLRHVRRRAAREPRSGSAGGGTAGAIESEQSVARTARPARDRLWSLWIAHGTAHLSTAGIERDACSSGRCQNGRAVARRHRQTVSAGSFSLGLCRPELCITHQVDLSGQGGRFDASRACARRTCERRSEARVSLVVAHTGNMVSDVAADSLHVLAQARRAWTHIDEQAV